MPRETACPQGTGMSSTVSTAIPHRGSRLRALGLAVEPYLYSAPALILITAVMLVPLAIGLSYAFRDIQLLNPMSGGYVGLAHFRDLLADPNFWNALKNTVQWTVASVALQFLLGLILALLLNRPFPGRGLVQALVFLPWAVPAFLSGLDWAWLFNPVVGLSWTTPVFDLPFRFTANARAEIDSYTAVPTADFDKVAASGRLQYVDTTNDQAYSPYIAYAPRWSYAPFYQNWLQTRQDLSFGVNKTFNFDANFRRVAFAADTLAETTWSFGVTAIIQRRFSNPEPSSWAFFVIPSATYVISNQWNLSLGLEFMRRGFDAFQGGPAEEDWLLQPIATLEYVLPSAWFGSERTATLLGRPALDFQMAYERNWSTVPLFDFSAWHVGAALKLGWRF